MEPLKFIADPFTLDVSSVRRPNTVATTKLYQSPANSLKKVLSAKR